jgi:hypothetical protein
MAGGSVEILGSLATEADGRRHDRREVEWAGKHEGHMPGGKRRARRERGGFVELGRLRSSHVGEESGLEVGKAHGEEIELVVAWLVLSSADQDRRDEGGGGCRVHWGRVGGRWGRATWGLRAGVRRGRERAHQMGGGAPWFIGRLRSLEGRTAERRNKDYPCSLNK